MNRELTMKNFDSSASMQVGRLMPSEDLLEQMEKLSIHCSTLLRDSSNEIFPELYDRNIQVYAECTYKVVSALFKLFYYCKHDMSFISAADCKYKTLKLVVALCFRLEQLGVDEKATLNEGKNEGWKLTFDLLVTRILCLTENLPNNITDRELNDSVN
ncbi:MAG: hypothetical protein OCD76_16540 [Reichenbachiella sp.]